ncbi:MAG: prolyl oligopeptidase family serine peptidase [Deltaproteobacteria bacterium]|nr:prolyl oligopeptidase family serine peptidase [Deltaproteobacteria bacterium]
MSSVDSSHADAFVTPDQRFDMPPISTDGATDHRLVDTSSVDVRAEPPRCTPRQEVCNGLDDDCNGVVDDELVDCDSCAVHHHELPMVTHWKVGVGVEYLAADQVDLYQSYVPTTPYDPAHCYYAYEQNIVPDYEDYLGDTYSIARISDNGVIDTFADICRLVDMPLRLFRSDGVAELAAHSGLVQILHAVPIDGSLATIILPPNWTPRAPTGSYPIIFNGFYDINENLVGQGGPHVLKAVALSGQDGHTGAIGVLWNGGGAVAGRTMDRRAHDQFAAVVDYVAKHFAGDRERILMFGASRGGYTSVAMASNPFQHNYRVVFAAPGVPPALVGEHAQLQSSTYPGLLGGVAWSLGLHNAWRPDFRYPACANKAHLTGKTGPEAHLYLLAGSTDFNAVNTTFSPLADDFINGLKAAGTQVYLEISTHDNIVPYVHQMAYAQRLIAEGIPVHVDVLVRGGHVRRNETSAYGTYPVRFGRLYDALLPLIDSSVAAYHVPPGIDFYRVNRDTKALESFALSDGVYPFTVEFPYRTVRGFSFPVVFAGAAQTEYTLSISGPSGQEVYTTTGTIPSKMYEIVWVDVAGDFPTGTYSYQLWIKKPGQAQVEVSPYNTPSADLAVTHVEASLPDVDGAGAQAWASGPAIGGFHETNWGLSEY